MDIHPDDLEEIGALRRDLIGWRVFLEKRQKDITTDAQMADTVVSSIERGEARGLRPFLIAKYAKVFRLAINIEFEDLYGEESTSLASLRNLIESDPFNGTWWEMYCLAFLRDNRVFLSIPAALMAGKMGMSETVFTKWETESDPDLLQLMAYARQLGGRMRIHLARVQ